MPCGPGVSPEAYAARLKTLEVGERFAVAVSGGRDSMALMRLSAEYAHGAGARVCAFIVDHGLRPDSARDAEQAAAWCAAVGVEANILPWRGQKPVTGVQAAARAARYRLLARAANQAGVAVIVTGHQSDDQIETMVMRLSRGAGPQGLAAMRERLAIADGAAAPVRLARPLLTFSRAQLEETLKRFRQPFLDDPSNDDERFERVRMRTVLREIGGLDRTALLRTIARMRIAADDGRRRDAAALRRAGGVFTRWGGAVFDAVRIDDISGDLAARLIHTVGGADHPPDPEKAEAALGDVQRGVDAVLGGAFMRRWRGRVWLFREPAALTGRAGVAPRASALLSSGAAMVWDRRFILAADRSLRVAALGADARSRLGPAGAVFDGPPAALDALPALYDGARLIGVPGVLSQGSGWTASSLAQERFEGGIIRFSEGLAS